MKNCLWKEKKHFLYGVQKQYEDNVIITFMSCSSCSCRRLCSSSSSSSLPLDLRLMSDPASTKPQYRELCVSILLQLEISVLVQCIHHFDLLNKQSNVFLQTQVIQNLPFIKLTQIACPMANSFS